MGVTAIVMWGEVCVLYVICDNKQHTFGHAMTTNLLGRGSVLGVLHLVLSIHTNTSQEEETGAETN